jgi:hypothetical protein
MTHDDVLWTALSDPSATASYDAEAWDTLVRQARGAKVFSRLAMLLDEQKRLDQVFPRAREHLLAARAIADKHRSALQWEITCLDKVLRNLDTPVVLLKGAAYLAADLPPARGRLYGDVDLMVPKAVLSHVEQHLLAHGWEPMVVHPYDQRYYRRWMHELPPLVHTTRRTVLDLHHTILPETGRVHPAPEKLFAAAKPLKERPFHILAPADMVLHSAAHLFQDGDLGGGIRDLTDLNDLLRHFGQRAGFWEQLVPRAVELDLARPLFYALRFSQRLLKTPIPEPVLAAASATGPSWSVGKAMDVLMTRALKPGIPGRVSAATATARGLLYVRSHWLRMPPGLLAAHLTRKALRRWYEKDPSKPAG